MRTGAGVLKDALVYQLQAFAGLRVSMKGEGSSAVFEGQERIMAMLARGEPPDDILSELCRSAEAHEPGALAAVLVLDRNSPCFDRVIAPTLGPSYTAPLAGAEVGPQVGTCAAAVYSGEAVTSTDIANDTRWTPAWRDLHLAHDIHACQSTPIFASDGRALGTFVLAFRQPRAPEAWDERTARLLIQLAGLTLERAGIIEELTELNQTLEERVDARTGEVRDMLSRLTESEHQFRHLVESVVDYAIFMLDTKGFVTSWNLGAERIKGYAASEIVGQHFSIFYTEEDQKNGVPQHALATARRTGRFQIEGWRRKKDGVRFWASVTINAVYDADGRFLGFAKVTRDLTARREAEEQIRQMQKMDAVGQLTGGIAHDFNNMLLVIGGNVETLQRRLPRADATTQRLLSAASRGVERAATLTHRLLAYSRRQPLDPKPIELNRLIIGMSDLLVRTLGAQIRVESVLSAGLWPISADANQIENAILNLALNARDAMPEGGKLTVETANTSLDEVYARSHQEVVAGQYVMVAVSDTGVGMTPDIVESAFEPFFTTKSRGEGTGLGLSQVYGFIKQSGGHLKIYSEPGEGTTVRLYLPRASDALNGDVENGREAPSLGLEGKETILVVEDDDDVRAYTTDILRELGYRVLEANEGDAALSLIASEPDIDLLFTDIGLPRPFNGRQLVDEARKLRTGIRVLFTTGYARNAIIHHGRLDPGVELIVKPFNFAGLAAKVRQVLDAPL